MLPPIEPGIRSANPKFDALYKDLCTNKLNEDGTSKLDVKAQKERDALSESLLKARLGVAKRDLIRSAFYGLSYRGSELPNELQELVAIVAALADGQISEKDRELLQDDLVKFKDNIEPITAAISKQLQQDADSLTHILNPDQPPSIESISSVIETHKNHIATSSSTVAQSRLAIAQQASDAYRLYQQVIESSIRILEQTIHGSVARGTKAKADYLAQVAEGMDKKLSLQHGQLMSQLYSPEIQEALKAKVESLESEKRLVTRKLREAEGKLEEFRTAEGMVDIAAEYAEILSETARVREEIERLNNR